jgi:hypothetical protein
MVWEHRKEKEDAKTPQESPLHLLRRVALLLGLCWQKFGLDEGNNTTLGDNNVTEEFAQPVGKFS